jgi:hypothetical protein
VAGQEYTTEELDGMLREAGDPATPPERLRAILRTGAGDAKVHPIKETLAANPSTPADLLPNLASYFPAAFSRNPVAPLVLLESPDFLRRMTLKRSLLRSGDAPAVLVQALTRYGADKRLHAEAAMHVALAGEVPDDDWRTAVGALWREQAAQATRTERAAYAELVALGLAPEWAADRAQVDEIAARLRRACDPATSTDDLGRLWTHSGSGPGEWMSGGSKDRLLHQVLCRNPSMPGREFARVTGRYYAPAEDAEEAWRVARHLAWIVGKGVRLPFTAFLRLTRPGGVRAPEAQKAARSNQWHERLGAACALDPKHRKSREALDTLAGDGNRYVRAAARARLRGETFAWDE